MGWTDIVPDIKKSGSYAFAQSPCVMGLTKGSGSRRQQITVIVRAAPEWWKVGAKVSVRTGTDAEAGLLRIEPGGLHQITSVKAGGGKAVVAHLRLPLLPGMTKAEPARTAVTHRNYDNAIVIELPAWAIASGASTRPPDTSAPLSQPPHAGSAAARVAEKGVPLRGALSATPDPRARRQAAR